MIRTNFAGFDRAQIGNNCDTAPRALIILNKLILIILPADVRSCAVLFSACADLYVLHKNK